MNINTLTDKIRQNNPLDFGDIFSKSIDLFKKTWLQGFIFTILSILIMIPAILIIYVPLFGMIAFQDIAQYEYGDPDFPLMAMLPFFLLFILAIILLNAVIFAMTAGFFKVMKKMDDGGEASTGDIFMYVKGKYLGKTLVISLMVVGISLLAALLCYLPIFYVMVPLNFAAVIFAFNPQLTPSEVIKASFNIGTKKWLIGFGLIIVSTILSELVGLLLCGIGIFFTAAFVYHPIYLMYKQVVGFEADGREMENSAG